MHLHVAIATRGRAALLERTLDSLAACDPVPELAGVHIVENGSKNDAHAVVRGFGGRLPVHYHHSARAGKARALQTVVEQIGTGLIYFSDDDVRFGPRTLAAYASAGREHGPDVVLGGPVRVDHEAAPPPWLRRYLPASVVGWDERDRRTLFLGSNYAAFAERILAVGGFDPRLGPGAPGNPLGDEDDLQQRLAAAGARTAYLPHAEVWHWVPAERCTPAWALHRYYRYRLTVAIHRPLADPDLAPRWFGVPRWYWRHVLPDALRLAALPFTPDPERRFRLKHVCYGHAGRVRAERLLRRDARHGRTALALAPDP